MSVWEQEPCNEWFRNEFTVNLKGHTTGKTTVTIILAYLYDVGDPITIIDIHC